MRGSQVLVQGGGRLQLLLVTTVAGMLVALAKHAAAEQCGWQAGGALCPDSFCCSQYGYCGTSRDYCGPSCQSQCSGPDTPSPPSGGGDSQGKASFYSPPYTPSACFGNEPDQFPQNQYFAAGGDSSTANIWNNGGNCGKFFNIQCIGNGCINSDKIQVKIVDRCPNGCVGGRAFDLSESAFNAIANPDVGVITVIFSPAFGDSRMEM